MADTDSFIPGGIRPPRKSIDGGFIWLYGSPKIGKTTFAAQFPGAWFIATEKGQEYIECREPTFVESWVEFIQWCKQMQTHAPREFGDGEKIQWLIVDTVDHLFRHCQNHVCTELGIEDPGELAHGKGWARLRHVWFNTFLKIRAWPFGIICISHPRTKETQVRNRKVNLTEPNVGAAAYSYLQGASDLILYCYSEEVAEKDENGKPTGKIVDKRKMCCHPQSWVVAGGRMSNILPPQMDLDYGKLREHLESLTTEE